MPPSSASSRKLILFGVFGAYASLVAGSALLPSAGERRATELARKLRALALVHAPNRSSKPAIATGWSAPAAHDGGRDVTIHYYHRIGSRSARANLLHPYALPRGRTRTVLHLGFNAADADELRLATAAALDAANRRSEVVSSVVFHGFTMAAPRLRRIVADLERRAGPARLAAARAAVLREVRDGSATELPIGTTLYAASGIFYREPGFPTVGGSGGWSRVVDARFEAMEALADARVPLR